ncbi:MAG: ROK family protein, partial [Clostridia bacterium]|nr:ROK family protein [Clostridia bacterium]
MKLKVEAILDKGFTPMMLVYREFTEGAKKAGGQKLVIGIERNKGYVSAFETVIYPENTGHDEENYEFVERLVKSLLWVRGGHKIIIAGSHLIADRLAKAYSKGGDREFDYDFMSGVYETTVSVEYRDI